MVPGQGHSPIAPVSYQLYIKEAPIDTHTLLLLAVWLSSEEMETISIPVQCRNSELSALILAAWTLQFIIRQLSLVTYSFSIENVNFEAHTVLMVKRQLINGSRDVSTLNAFQWVNAHPCRIQRLLGIVLFPSLLFTHFNLHEHSLPNMMSLRDYVAASTYIGLCNCHQLFIFSSGIWPAVYRRCSVLSCLHQTLPSIFLHSDPCESSVVKTQALLFSSCQSEIAHWAMMRASQWWRWVQTTRPSFITPLTWSIQVSFTLSFHPLMINSPLYCMWDILSVQGHRELLHAGCKAHL